MSKLKITIEDLFELPTSEIINPDVYESVDYVSTDSRSIKPGSLFVAIKGENFDGHDYVKEAVKKGADAILIENKQLNKFENINKTIITVDDTTAAFGFLANVWRNKLKAKVISVTGSNGKTSTKEMLATVLSEKYITVKTAANNNNHIGVPLTIFEADSKCEALVLEQGTNHFGEIEYSAKISEPDFALITNIGDSHLEYLKNREGVYKEKSALFTAAIKNKGVCFINTDDSVIKKNSARIKNKVTYGFNSKPDVKGEILGYTADGKSIISAAYKGKEVTVELPVYGVSNAKNFLAVCAVAFKLGLTPEEITKGAAKLTDTKGRLQAAKYKNFLLFDDTYNSNPSSVEAAVEVMENITSYTNKVLVLGDMMELGNKAEKLHKDLYKVIPNKKNYTVLTTGSLMKNLSISLKKNINSKHFETRKELAKYLKSLALNDSAILVKGSRSMKMEEFAKVLADRGK